MTNTKFVICTISLTTILLAGCQTDPVAQTCLKPQVNILSLAVTEARLDYATLKFDVELSNPYTTPLLLKNLRYSLTSGASTFLTAAGANNITIPPQSKQTVSLPDRVYYDRLLRALNAKPDTTIPYDVGIWLHTETKDHYPIGISARHKGALSLPAAPKITIEGKEYNTVDVVFVATPPDVVDKMLEIAYVSQNDTLCDLGCGDGRIPVAASKKFGCKSFGYDIDPERVREAIQNARTNNVQNLVTIQQKDIYTVDLSPISVVAIYLLPKMNEKLIPQFKQLKPGSRIVAHNFPIPGIKPDKTTTMASQDDNTDHTIFLYTIPLKEMSPTETTP